MKREIPLNIIEYICRLANQRRTIALSDNTNKDDMLKYIDEEIYKFEIKYNVHIFADTLIVDDRI